MVPIYPEAIVFESNGNDYAELIQGLDRRVAANVVRTSTGEETIRLLQRRRRVRRLPRLVALDSDAKSLNGYDVLAWMHSQPWLCQVRIVLFAEAFPEPIAQAAALFTPDNLLHKSADRAAFFAEMSATFCKYFTPDIGQTEPRHELKTPAHCGAIADRDGKAGAGHAFARMGLPSVGNVLAD
jgi:hypothetical protein